MVCSFGSGRWTSRSLHLRLDQRFGGASNVPCRTAYAQNLGADLRPFHEEKQLVGQ
jgi:hypothetical protein